MYFPTPDHIYVTGNSFDTRSITRSPGASQDTLSFDDTFVVTFLLLLYMYLLYV